MGVCLGNCSCGKPCRRSDDFCENHICDDCRNERERKESFGKTTLSGFITQQELEILKALGFKPEGQQKDTALFRVPISLFDILSNIARAPDPRNTIPSDPPEGVQSVLSLMESWDEDTCPSQKPPET